VTPQQLVEHLDQRGIQRREFADRLGVTEAAISYWLKQGWMTYERQCSVQIELGGALLASWNDVPEDKRPQHQPARLAL
jgi:transcriptional regulator with XRE-family HTH domain